MFSFGSSEPVCWSHLDVFGFVQTKKTSFLYIFISYWLLFSSTDFFFFLNKPDSKPDPQTDKRYSF